MSNPPEASPVPEDTATVILKVLQRANEPLTVARIQKELPGPFRIDSVKLAEFLDNQVCTGAIYKWLPKRSQKRFWTQDLEEYSRKNIVEILSEQALIGSKLKDALRKSLFGCSDSKATEVGQNGLKWLVKEKRLFKHPPVGRQRSPRFGVNPPDPSPYLGKVKKEFEKVCEKLKKSGVSPDQVFQAASKVLMPRPHQDFVKVIMNKIVEIEPAARQQALVSIPALRAALDLPKEAFDQAILDLAGQARIFLHRHVHPAQISGEEGVQMVTDGKGNYYVGIVLRG